ncbi:MAG: flavodoxin family protein [bacterium]|nr:flavodoxin family protein [bacterium]
MTKVLVIYYSRTGNTKKMAESVAKGANEAGAEVTLKPVDGTNYKEMLDYDGIIIGSPVYYGHSAGVIRSLIDESVKIHGRLDGKIGGAFASSAYIAGGNETTVMDIIHAMMIHGMIVKGNFKGNHYGPVSINKPDDKVLDECRKYGASIVELANKLK